jgi:hypothetical protein
MPSDRKGYTRMVMTTTNKIFIAINAAAFLVSSSAHGQTSVHSSDFPLYASSKQCDALARIMSAADQSLRVSCLQLDERQKELLRRQWNDVPAEVTQVCIKRNDAAKAVEGYTSLASCIVEGVGRMWLDGKLKIVAPLITK